MQPAPARIAIPASIRDRFPALSPAAPIYLDSAATTQKPDTVIAAVTDYLSQRTANAGRGAYPWSTSLARRIAEIRARAASFIGAGSPDEVVFTSGATAGLNAVALAWGLTNLADGDEILYRADDHAANVAPWMVLRDTLAHFGRRIALRPYRSTASGEADLDDVAAALSSRTRLITVSHVHHVYGARSTLEELRLPASTLLCFDCSQSGGHLPVDVTELGADFAVFAGHKMFASPGVGLLYCARRVHDQLRPFLPGGESGAAMPTLLEGGTYDIGAVLSLAPAFDFLDEVGRAAIAEHNLALTQRLIAGLRTIPGLEFTPGPAFAGCAVGYGIVAFTVAELSSADLGFALADAGFFVRTGAHCVPTAASDGSVRVSTQVYTSADDVDRFVDCLGALVR
ncbi:aminotransferase class V-fold PLP-dependent enzyme [Nocardia camponoti]|uniref:Cysteine desulfurase n=1 Tax=Nocardia camponoti TaxID=1616106 RepID=A0A917V3K4_9NOCA|nr:aminotransferase class V-fold PLP-dependent enzyme [Nocardia camponoti]GGK34885.1 cysteine desulfurase [Nocardia camponoti]